MRMIKVVQFLMIMVLTTIAGVAVADYNSWNAFATVGTLIVAGLATQTPIGALAMAYVPISVLMATVSNTQGGNKKDRLVIIDANDIATWPTRSNTYAEFTGNFVLAAGKYMVELYVSASTVKVGCDADGEADKKGFIHSLEAEHPGDSKEIRTFLENWVNKNIIIIYENCVTGELRVLGTRCAPLQLAPKSESDKDKTTNVLVFKSVVKAPVVPGTYAGTTTLPSVMGTPAAGATTVDVTAGQGEYQLTTGSGSAAALTGLTGTIIDGGYYTLLGSGGTYPSTIAASGNWILSNGTAWTALAGSRITFKAYKDGASSWKFIETARS